MESRIFFHVLGKIPSRMMAWYLSMRIYWSHILTYRANFVFQFVGPVIIFYFVKFQLWNTIYGGEPNISINEMSRESMLTYHYYVMIAALFIQGHTGINISEEIRLGRISKYLIYPISFFEFQFTQFMALQCVHLLMALGLYGFGISIAVIKINALSFSLGVAYSLFMSILWFQVQFLLGLMAFWLEETWILRVMFLIVAQFLSGAIIPISFFPELWQGFLFYSPFPYLTFVPTKIFMGEQSISSIILLIPTAWTFFFGFLNYKVWTKGLKNFTAAGM